MKSQLLIIILATLPCFSVELNKSKLKNEDIKIASNVHISKLTKADSNTSYLDYIAVVKFNNKIDKTNLNKDQIILIAKLKYESEMVDYKSKLAIFKRIELIKKGEEN